MREYIATFYTHFAASQFARALKAQAVRHRMMPVPRALSSSCGTCVRLWAEPGRALPRVDDMEGLYLVDGERYAPLDLNAPEA